MDDCNDLAYWFPRLLQSGVAVPRTELVQTDINLTAILDGDTPAGYHALLSQLAAAADKVGYPCFLRTGHGSAKHDWERTCFVRRPEELGSHVVNLVEWSGEVDLLGLPCRTWAVRELLDAAPAFRANRGMPIGRERRYFFAGGKVQCHHPYWPHDAILTTNRPDWRAQLDLLNHEDDEEVRLLTRLTEELVAPHFDGAWSLDWLWCPARGWVAIDMAEADRSFHWPGCPFEPREQREARTKVHEKIDLTLLRTPQVPGA